MPTLLISVRFHDGRYHGGGEWPPSPARLFQALVAGAARGENLCEHAVEAFEWLESLDAPVIAAPPTYAGQELQELRPQQRSRRGRRRSMRGSAKYGRPKLSGHARSMPPFRCFTHGRSSRARMPSAMRARSARSADDLYQLGRGVDMAWAQGETLEDGEAEARLRGHGGVRAAPQQGRWGRDAFMSPSRFAGEFEKALCGNARAVQDDRKGQGARQLFSQAPKPDFLPSAVQ